MVLNETTILGAPLIGPIAKAIVAFQGVIGGLFGLYLILVILKWRESKQLIGIMKDIRHDIGKINERLNPPKKVKKKKK